MPRKKTIEELEAEARKAEARAKELRKQAQKLTKAEEARINAEVIKALHEWLDSFPPEKHVEWKSVPDIFRQWTEQNKQRYDQR
jgi:hypothetical protein